MVAEERHNNGVLFNPMSTGPPCRVWQRPQQPAVLCHVSPVTGSVAMTHTACTIVSRKRSGGVDGHEESF